MISTELMVATQSDQMQKWIMRAMPIVFVLFLFNFPAGLFVYWVTTNVWTIGQQLVIRKTMPKPEELAARAKSKPKKRSRFMETMMTSQQEAAKQREQRIAQKSGGQAGAKSGASGATGGKKPAQGAKKAAPPGKGKRKPGYEPGRQDRPDGRQDRPERALSPRPGGQTKPPAGAQGKPAAQQSQGGSSAAGDQGANTSADGPADD